MVAEALREKLFSEVPLLEVELGGEGSDRPSPVCPFSLPHPGKWTSRGGNRTQLERELKPGANRAFFSSGTWPREQVLRPWRLQLLQNENPVPAGVGSTSPAWGVVSRGAPFLLVSFAAKHILGCKLDQPSGSGPSISQFQR